MKDDEKQSEESKDALRIFSGNSNLPLAREVCAHLGTTLAQAEIRRFSDGEINVDIQENVRGSDVFVIQSTSTPTNDHLMELLLMVTTLRRASARRARWHGWHAARSAPPCR